MAANGTSGSNGAAALGSSSIAAAESILPTSRPGLSRTATAAIAPGPAAPATYPPLAQSQDASMVLELADGTAYAGTSFGAEGKSISGECVFQTGE